jgi:DNA helicase-2/ATP-dependent DNA helicase PcrA
MTIRHYTEQQAQAEFGHKSDAEKQELVYGKSSRTWSPYQNGCFTFITTGTGNAIVDAKAGSGKSTTGEEMVRRIPNPSHSHVYLAFNKAIADEMKGRGVNGRTFHSLTYTPVTRAKGCNNVDSNKLRLLIQDAVGNEEIQTATRNNASVPRSPALNYMSKNDSYLYGNLIVRLVGLARNAGIGCLCQNIPEVWQGLVDYHDLELDSEAATIDRGIELAMQLLEWSNRSPLLDFDDLLYFAVRDNISLPKFDYVFVDEAQDTNSIQRAILKKIMKPTSRLIAVGDPAQAIYGFRGADSNSMRMIADEFGCTELPLTVTYRCATSIVDFAKQWVPAIEAAPGAVEGVVRNADQDWTHEDFKFDDLVVCRTSRPLVALAYQFLRARIPARVMGKDIGEGLKSLVKKMNAKGIDALVDKLEDFTQREMTKAIAKGSEAKAEAIQDKTDSVMCLIEGLPETDRTVPALLQTIDDLFNDRRSGVTLATIHKSKGLEANRVWWLNASKCPASWARQPWQKQQERNLCYVAATRAKSELVMFEERERVKIGKAEAADVVA